MMRSVKLPPRPARYIRVEALEAYHPNQGRSPLPVTRSMTDGKVSIAELEVVTTRPVP